MCSYQETAVIIQKDIENLNSFKQIDQFINLCLFCHLKRCEKDNNCINCNFITNLRFVYVENVLDSTNGVENCQAFCRKHFGSFFSLGTFLRTLAIVEREKIKTEKKFVGVLNVWNTKET